MHKNRGPVYYGDYLQLEKFLGSQGPLSKKYGDECHDEMLFIIVHQAYEIWFKQILHELSSITDIFSQNFIEEKALAKCLSRIERIEKIQGLLFDQLEILETMTPMDFLEFRDLLIPASGFQSVQFREIEIRLGLGTENRENIDREYFLGRLNDKDRDHLLKVEAKPSFLELLERWLERIPFTLSEDFDFWKEYGKAVNDMLDEDEKIIKHNTMLKEDEKKAQLQNFLQTRETFASLLEEEKFQEQKQKGLRTLSRKAMLNALFILLYRDEPILNQPFRFLNALIDIDENFTAWRHRHALMAHRMLGKKIGTGGSSGHEYLKRAADNNRVFTDLFDLSTFLIPRSMLPELPAGLKDELDFHFGKKKDR